MNVRLLARNVLMILAGVAGLVMKRWLAVYLGDLAYSYLGNLAVSFAVYFWVSIAAPARLNRVMIAAMALAVVEVFEFTDGFRIMTNVYDPFDYLANALGVGLAYFIDVISTHIIKTNSGSP